MQAQTDSCPPANHPTKTSPSDLGTTSPPTTTTSAAECTPSTETVGQVQTPAASATPSLFAVDKPRRLLPASTFAVHDSGNGTSETLSSTTTTATTTIAASSIFALPYSSPSSPSRLVFGRPLHDEAAEDAKQSGGVPFTPRRLSFPSRLSLQMPTRPSGSPILDPALGYSVARRPRVDFARACMMTTILC